MIDLPRLESELETLRVRFVKARPFPHVIIDDAFDETLLKAALSEWPADDHQEWRQYQKGKRAFITPAAAAPTVSRLMRAGNDPQFVNWLARMTDVPDLQPDHELRGGGLHEVAREGSLGIHVDFNRLGDLYRRVNVLLFLNEDWRPKWGGNLELRGSPKQTLDSVLVSPDFNRLVIFESSESSWHGHPSPLMCPKDRKRRSVAWYFYSAEPHPSYVSQHSTVYIKTRRNKTPKAGVPQ